MCVNQENLCAYTREFVCLYKRICVLIQENLCAYILCNPLISMLSAYLKAFKSFKNN